MWAETTTELMKTAFEVNSYLTNKDRVALVVTQEEAHNLIVDCALNSSVLPNTPETLQGLLELVHYGKTDKLRFNDLKLVVTAPSNQEVRYE